MEMSFNNSMWHHYCVPAMGEIMALPHIRTIKHITHICTYPRLFFEMVWTFHYLTLLCWLIFRKMKWIAKKTTLLLLCKGIRDNGRTPQELCPFIRRGRTLHSLHRLQLHWMNCNSLVIKINNNNYNFSISYWLLTQSMDIKLPGL